MARKVALQHRSQQIPRRQSTLELTKSTGRFFENLEQKDGATLEEMIPFMDELAVHYVATAEDKRPLKRLYDDINLTIEEELKAQKILAWLFYTRVRLRMLGKGLFPGVLSFMAR
jgi:allophanate hydrolase subunit 1